MKYFDIERAKRENPNLTDEEIQRFMRENNLTAKPRAEAPGMETTSPDIFNKPAAAQAPVKTQEEKTAENLKTHEEGRGFFQKVGDFFLPRATQLTEKLAGSTVLKKELDAADKTYAEFKKIADDYAEQAKNEPDPEKKKKLFELGMQALEAGEQGYKSAQTQFETSTGTGIGEETSLVREAAGVAGEIGSYFIPAGKLAKDATLVQKILHGAKLGGKSGLLLGVTSPEDLTAKERAFEAAKQGAWGYTIGGLMTAAWEVPKAGVKKILAGSKDRLARVFKVSPGKAVEFETKTGGMDFTEEILTRDGKAIAGMDHEELIEHFGRRKAEAIAAKARLQSESGKTISKADILAILNRQREQLTPEKGFLESASGGIKTTLDAIEKDIMGMADEIPEAAAENIKTQLQAEGSKAWAASGNKPTSASNAYDEMGRAMKGLIEDVHKPVAEVGVTSFKGQPVSTIAETLPNFETPKAKGVENALTNNAPDFNIKNPKVSRTAGIWEGGLEHSYNVDIDAGHKAQDIFEYAAASGAKTGQDAVAVFVEGAGDGIKYEFSNLADADEAIRLMTESGIPGGKIVNGNKLVIYDDLVDSNLPSAIMDLGEKLNDKPTTTKGYIEFIEKANNYTSNLAGTGGGKGRDFVLPDISAEAANPLKEANRTIQLYRHAEDSIKRASKSEVNKLSNDVFQKYFQVIPAVAGLGLGAATGNVPAGAGTFVLAQAMLGSIGAARIKYFTPQVQTKIANSFATALRNQGVKNADKVATRIVQEMIKVAVVRNSDRLLDKHDKVVSGQAEDYTAGAKQQEQGEDRGEQGNIEGHTPSVAPSDTDVKQPMDTTEPGIMDEMVTMRNKKTGEVRQFKKSEIGKPQPGSAGSGALPSKEDILTAMAIDINNGGKNVAKLNTLLNAIYKQEKAAGGNLTTTDKKRLRELDQAEGIFNQLAPLALSTEDLKEFGITAEEGVEPAKTGMVGWWAKTVGKLPGVEGGSSEDLERVTQGLAKAIAGALASEVGVATDKDVQRWLGLMPKVSDTPAERKRALKRLREELDMQRERIMIGNEMPDESGTNFYGGESPF